VIITDKLNAIINMIIMDGEAKDGRQRKGSTLK